MNTPWRIRPRGASGGSHAKTAVSRTARLIAAYTAARYQVQWRGRWAVSGVGARSSAIDDMLRQMRARRWVFITAFNPASRQVAPLRNALANRRLRSVLMSEGWRVLPALADGPGWPAEPGYFVLDLPVRDAAALGRCFGQAAVVRGARHAAPVLVWCGLGG